MRPQDKCRDKVPPLCVGCADCVGISILYLNMDTERGFYGLGKQKEAKGAKEGKEKGETEKKG